LAFDGDRAKLSPRTHRLSELTRLLTGEPLPYASLVYVWSNTEPVGAVVVNPRTDRIRKLVVESGADQLGAGATTNAMCTPILCRRLASHPGL
jgi:hypothetical protein